MSPLITQNMNKDFIWSKLACISKNESSLIFEWLFLSIFYYIFIPNRSPSTLFMLFDQLINVSQCRLLCPYNFASKLFLLIMALRVNTWGNKGYREKGSCSFVIVCGTQSPHGVPSLSRQSKQNTMLYAAVALSW